MQGKGYIHAMWVVFNRYSESVVESSWHVQKPAQVYDVVTSRDFRGCTRELVTIIQLSAKPKLWVHRVTPG